MTPVFRGFLIDADNTLFDFNRAERHALLHTLAAHGIDRLPGDVHHRYHAINDELWMEFERGRLSQEELRTERFVRLLTGLGPSLEPSGAYPQDLPSTLSAFYLGSLGRRGYLLPYARKVLAGLAATASLVLLTNGIPEVQRQRLAASGIEPYFKSVVISGEVGLAKPDPRIFELALQRLGMGADGVLCVGDSPSSDIRGASQAGIASCWFSRGNTEYPADEPPPTYRIRDLRELLRFAPPAAGGAPGPTGP